MRDHKELRCWTDCAFLSRKSGVPGEGPIPNKIVIIGEAPTPAAQAVGRPFPTSTDSGRVLEKWLSYLGLKREALFITNLVKCPRAEGQWEEQVNSCLPWLENEIRIVEPRLVVTLGGEVHKRFVAAYLSREYRPSQNSPLFHVWENYPSCGGCQEHEGVFFFALVHPSTAVRLGKDIPDYLPPYLDALRQLLSKII